MKWYRNLYLTEGVHQNKRTIIEKIEKNAGLPGICLVTLAANGRDLFDIFSANLLFQTPLHGHCPVIVGIAKGKEEAIDLAAQLALAAYRQNGDFDIRKYLCVQWQKLSDLEKEEELQIEKELRARAGEDADGSFYFVYPMERLKKRRRFWRQK